MTNQWAKSFSYREALDGLTARFAELRQKDRMVTHELMPNIESIDGFLFAINAAPAPVSPTEWLGELLPLVQLPDEKPSEAVNLLISYSLHSKSRMEQQQYAVPEETDSLRALAPASPMNSFCHGFEVGYRKIESVWSATVAQELRGELDAQILALRFFASTEYANKTIKDRGLKIRPDQLADQILANLPKAADLHVRLGMAIEAEKGVSH
jgi:yecA family protein